MIDSIVRVRHGIRPDLLINPNQDTLTVPLIGLLESLRTFVETMQAAGFQPIRTWRLNTLRGFPEPRTQLHVQSNSRIATALRAKSRLRIRRSSIQARIAHCSSQVRSIKRTPIHRLAVSAYQLVDARPTRIPSL
jgi:hypothetical protein